MIKKTLLITLLAGVMSVSAHAEKASRAENTGVGVGVVVGGIAGGPVGAIIGAALGAKVGDEFHERNVSVANLSASLENSAQQVSSLEQDIVALNGELRSREAELQHARSEAKPELLSLLQAGIAMDLLFRTDEDVLSDATGNKLRQLALSLTGKPDIQVRLDGFADERGDASYNQALSSRRAEYVRDVLIDNGVPASRITVNAQGESLAAEPTPDSFALERRVSMTLYVGETPSFASNP